MLRIAITGGIGSGKTAVTDYLEKKEYKLIDADKISREMTGSGGSAIPFIRENFGSEFILPDGSLDRAKMRELVYNDPEKKKLLEEGTTKLVILEIDKRLSEYEASALYDVIFVSIPLLFEYKLSDAYDSVWLIYSDLRTRIERIKERDGLTEEEIVKIIKNQYDDEYKMEASDIIIDNSSSLDDLYARIDTILEKFGLC